MTALPTFDELYDAGKAEAEARDSRLTDWNPGSVLDALAGAAAALADLVLGVVVDLFRAHFLDTATDADLDALVLDRFGLSRQAASYAVGTLTFTRGVAVGDLLIPGGTRVQATVDGLTVVVATDADTTMASAESTVDVLATATVLGRDGNVAAGTLTTILDAIPGDASATVTNAARFAGGEAEETDEALRDRARRYYRSLRRGTVDALRDGAVSVAGVTYATVDESTVPPASGGYVSVYVGDPDGSGNTALAAAVAAELEDYRAAGVEVRVFGATREEIDLYLTIRYVTGSDVSALRTAIRASVLAYVDSLDPGETLYESQVEKAAIVSDLVVDAKQTTPTGDAVPSQAYNALRVQSGDLVLTFVEDT